MLHPIYQCICVCVHFICEVRFSFLYYVSIFIQFFFLLLFLLPLYFFRLIKLDRALYGGRNSSSRASRPSSREDVHLKEAENAWKPAFMTRKSDEQKDEIQELYRQVRSILNKLTANNFGVLSEQFRQLQIDTKEKLSGVVDLVFEKAVNEPNFSVEYGQLCNYLAERSRNIVTSPTERAYFKRMLINKCQIEFEQNVANKNTTEVALAPLFAKLNVCEKDGASNDAILEIKEQIAEEESKLRRRLVCTVRFIGELYKLDMLTTNIMNVCIKSLIDSRTDEKLECVCKILTTIGKKLERKPKTEEDKTKYLNLADYINQLKQIAERKIPNVKVSTRIR